MCTVLFAYKKISGWPLVIANNRDEFFQRRALPPRIYSDSRKRERHWLASCDLTGGGSWWGCNNRGLLVLLTNRWTADEFEPGLRSRGELVTAMLSCADADEARAALEKNCDGNTFNPFNLIIATREDAFFATNSPELHFLWLSAGFHYLGNAALEDQTSLKARSAGRLFVGFSGHESLDETLQVFRQALRTPLPQDSIPPQGFNVKFDGYGTTSSLFLSLPESERKPLRLHYCEQNPLYGDYLDCSKLALLL